MATNSPDRRSDRPDMTREPTAPRPEPPDDDPLVEALRTSQRGSAQAGAALSRRARQVVFVVVAVFAVSIAVNTGTNVVLFDRASDVAVERAEAARLNGAAQEQARRAAADAAPANVRLREQRLFAIPIPPPWQSPASEIIANSASVQVLADMPREAIVDEDYVALGAAVERFYQRQPQVTQSGPAPLKVQQLCQQYLQVARRLTEKGVL